MSKQTKDIPPIPTIQADPPASPPSLIPKKEQEPFANGGLVPNHPSYLVGESCIGSTVPKKEGKENDPLSAYPTNPLPHLTFVCSHCTIRVTIQPIIVPMHFNNVFCPLCRTLYAYATQDCLPKLRSPEYGPIIIDESVGIRIELDPATAARWYGETDDPPDIIEELQTRTKKKINDRHNAIDLLYQMRYVCRCVAPEPENGWCKYCGRLLQDE